MHIFSDYKNTNVNNSNTINTINDTNKSKNIPVQNGTSIYGEVIDLKRNEISLKLSNGDILKGKITSFDNIEIGFKGSFKVNYNENGQLIIEINENAKENIENNIIIQALKNLGFKSTQENIDIINILINNQFPVTKETFQKLNQALKLVGKENINEALYFIQNNIKLGLKNSEQVNGYANNEIKINNQIKNLVSDIVEVFSNSNNITNIISNNNLLEETKVNINLMYKQLNKILENNYHNTETKDDINNIELTEQPKLSNQINIINENEFNSFILENKSYLTQKAITSIKNNSLENINLNIKELGYNKEINTLKAYEILFENQPQILKKISDIISSKNNYIDKIVKQLSFKFKSTSIDDLESYLNELTEKINEITKEISKNNFNKNEKILNDITDINKNIEFMSYEKNNFFLQIPLNINNQNTTADLYVFKDKKAKRKNNNYISALISLDLKTLGHLETYIQKNNNSIAFQFRIENEKIENLIKENINILEKNLKERNYNINQISFKKIDEAFTILDKEPVFEENKIISEKEIKKLKFDIRT